MLFSLLLNHGHELQVFCFFFTQEPGSDERFHVELHFSPGACTLGPEINKDPTGLGYRSQYAQKVRHHLSLNCLCVALSQCVVHIIVKCSNISLNMYNVIKVNADETVV